MQFNTIVLLDVNTIVLDDHCCVVLNSYPMKLGERLRAARKHAGMSQEELGDKAGCGQGVVSKIERGDQDTTAYVVKLARACGVSVDWLDDGSGEMLGIPHPQTPEQLKVLQAMANMPKHQQQNLVKISNTFAEPETLDGTNGAPASSQ